MKHLLWLMPLIIASGILYVNQGGSGPVFLAGLLYAFSVVIVLFIRFDAKHGPIEGYKEVHTNDRKYHR